MWWTILGIGIVVILLLLVYASIIEIRWYDITEPTIQIPMLSDAFDGYRIAHITDIHMDSHMTRDRLKAVAARIHDLKPDLIVITGDFVSYNVEYVTDDLINALSEFHAPDGVLAVTGNHDHKTDVDMVREILSHTDIRELRNASTCIEREGKRLYIAGVDSVMYQKADLEATLKDIPDDDSPAILLAHEPDFADVAAVKKRFALQLSGHTHGGQVQMPGYGAMYGPEHGHIYSDGLYDVTDSMQVYVSRGVGTVMAPIRFNCRPEITLLTLRQAV